MDYQKKKKKRYAQTQNPQEGQSQAIAATTVRTGRAGTDRWLPYHAWLEERAEKACLLVFIDDATSEILAAEFVTSGPIQRFVSVISANLGFQKGSTRITSVFPGSIRPI